MVTKSPIVYTSRVLVILMCICFFASSNSLANTVLPDLEYSARFQYGGCDSYAWNNEYVFLARGYMLGSEYEQAWMASHYSLTRLDRLTGEAVTLYDNIRAAGMDLSISSDRLFLFSQYQPFSNLPGNEGDCKIQVIGFDGKKIMPDRMISADEFIQDHVFWGDVLYLLTETSILKLDIMSGSLYTIYRGGKIWNDIYNAHALLYGRKLYFQVNNMIKSLNMDTLIIEDVVSIDCDEDFDLYFYIDSRRHDRDHWKLVQQSYRYMIANGAVFYYNHKSKMLWIYDLDNKTTAETVMQDCHFSQMCSDGIVSYFYIANNKDIYSGGEAEVYLIPWRCFSTQGINDKDLIKLDETKAYILVDDGCYLKDDEMACVGDLGYEGAPIVCLHHLEADQK